MNHSRRKAEAQRVAVVPKARFASDDFAYYLRLYKAPGIVPPPEGNFDVTLGSGPMMFEVGSYGNAQAQIQALYGTSSQIVTSTPDGNVSTVPG